MDAEAKPFSRARDFPKDENPSIGKAKPHNYIWHKKRRPLRDIAEGGFGRKFSSFIKTGHNRKDGISA